MVKVRGRVEHSRRLKAMVSPAAERRVYKALFAAGQLIELEAERSITEGSVSGKNHVPSLPGQPPNADTRLLDTSIETTGEPARMRVKVTSNAPYSVDLERGNSKMEERPFMRPASRKKRAAAQRLIAEAQQRNVKG